MNNQFVIVILLAYIPGLLPFLYNHLIIHQHHGGTEQESCEIDTKYSQFYNVQKSFSQVLLTKYLQVRILAAEQTMKAQCRKLGHDKNFDGQCP